MNGKRWIVILIALIVALGLAATALADDGIVFRKNISKIPEGETEKAGISMMYFYVPAQAADGTLLTEGLSYVLSDTVTVAETRYFAKPLTAVYIDEEHHEDVAEADLSGLFSVTSGLSFGHHDAFIAHSLDDGATWKSTNVSRSAELSSFVLANGEVYPGDVYAAVQATAGDRIMIAWLSRYCDGGNPLYTQTDPDKDTDGTIKSILQNTYFLPDLYVTDIWGVAGTQKSVDYTMQGFPEVGEIPYGCVWTARGKLVPTTDESTSDTSYDILWTKPERLTSGRRDANRLEIDARTNGGFVITWQEDPEGLRPGQGLGPGEGWSGAIVNGKTDIWYSYVSWEHFDLLDPDDDIVTANAVTMDEYLTLYPDGTIPKIEVPMAIPMRLTDNNMCRDVKSDPYCYVDFDELDENGNVDLPDVLPTAPSPDSDLCTTTVAWTTPGGTILNVCQTEDGRYLRGRVGASRPRIGLYPVTSADSLTDYGRYYLVIAYEETKALGEGVLEEEVDPIDIGKNIWYHSFDMFKPDLVAQGGMLNQPASDPLTGEFFEIQVDDFTTYEFYETEIARRFSLVAQPYSMIGDTRTTAFLIYKQGVINQGGPADVFARRIVLPDTFDPATENPYDFKYMACENWAYADGSNPTYLQGLCLDPAVNFSGTTIELCDNGTSGDACAALFPWDGGTTYPKLIEWSQSPENLTQQSWTNPYDISKGHRGFLDGDFLMVLYAWSPNWKSNSVGNDHYNLYVRRSFDGGQTFTTTPASLGGDGTNTCENYGHGSDIYQVCTDYAAGEFEQARNVSQLIGNKITILDPRYTPTGGLKMLLPKDALELGAAEIPYWDDAARDRSMYFLIYETGDNTTVTDGEAVPLDLFYSRASAYGDDYDDVITTVDEDNKILFTWDWVEYKRDDLSGEAGMTANPGGTMMYTVWNQWQELEEEVVSNSDIIFRRFYYNTRVDALPVATVLSVIPDMVVFGDVIDLYGAGRDFDRLGEGIVAYRWESSKDGVLVNQTRQHLNIPATDLSTGVHTITFSVLDDEGNWTSTSFEIAVYQEWHVLHIPVVIQR
jgi:hypothetical protein